MSSPSLELKKVKITKSPLGRRTTWIITLLTALSGGLGLMQTAGLVIETHDGWFSPLRTSQILSALSPWRSDHWSSQALYSRDKANIETALKRRLMLSPVSSEDWIHLARLKLNGVNGEMDLANGKSALREAFDVAPRSPSLQRVRFALATLVEADQTLEVALRRDLKWALTSTADRATLVSELGAFATPYGLQVLKEVEASLPPA